MENNDQDIVSRLRSLGAQPIDPDLAARHASYLSAASPVTARTRRRPAVTAAFVAGLLLGGTGLAAAVPGPLPTQATSVAKSALQAVQLADDEPKDPVKEVEKAKAKAARAAAKAAGGKGGGVARFTEGCDDGMLVKPYNHGQYVKAHPDIPGDTVNQRQVAAETDCGKPAKAVANKARAGAAGDKDENESGKPADTGQPADTGRPESPGKSDSKPPAAAVPEQGSENRTTQPGNAAEQNRSEDAGATTTTTAATTTTTSTAVTTTSTP